MKENLFVQSSAMVRVKEKSLLTPSQFERLIESETLEEALRNLQDSSYQPYIQELERPEDYEEVLSKAWHDTLEEILEMAPDERIVYFTQAKYDFHNIKVVIKEKILGQNFSHILMRDGRVDPNNLREELKTGERSLLDPFYQDLVNKVYDYYKEHQDPQLIDVLVDRFYFRYLKELAEEFKLPILVQYVEELIDLTNIRSFLRAQRQEKELDFLDLILLEGGEIPVDDFKDFYFQQVNENSSLLKKSRIYYDIQEAIQEYTNTNSLSTFEKAMDDILMETIKQAKSSTYGPEVLIGYLMAKETEIKNLRIIFVSKLNDLPKDVIRERVRENYA